MFMDANDSEENNGGEAANGVALKAVKTLKEDEADKKRHCNEVKNTVPLTALNTFIGGGDVRGSNPNSPNPLYKGEGNGGSGVLPAPPLPSFPRGIDILTLGDLLDSEAPATEWLIEGILPAKGIAFVAGEPKSAKTWLVFEMVKSVTSGKSFLGHHCYKSSVLVIDGENGKDEIKRRMTKFMYELSNEAKLAVRQNSYVLSRTGFTFADENYGVFDAFVKVWNIKVIVLDPFRRFFKGDENDSMAVGQFIDRIRRIADRYGILFIIVHHTNKQSKRYGGHELDGSKMRGSSDIYGSADVICMVKKNGKASREKINFSVGHEIRCSSPIDALHLKLEFLKEEGGREFARLSVDDEAKEKMEAPTKTASIKAAVLALFNEKKPEAGFETKDILASLVPQYSESTVENALTELVYEKSLEKPERGRYKLPSSTLAGW